MLEVGWSEMLVIAIVMIVVVNPKDLPGMLRTFGRSMTSLRKMAGDFQKQFNEALQEAELDDVKKSVDSLRSLNPAAEIRKQLNPFEKAASDVRSGLDGLMKPKPPAPAVAEAHPAEPLKVGPSGLPGEVAETPEPPQAAGVVSTAKSVSAASRAGRSAAARPAAKPKPSAAKSPPKPPAKKPETRA